LTKGEKMSDIINSDLKEVIAPLSGTIYLSPGTEENNYFEIGVVIPENQTIFLIEAMKLFNEITMPERGIIRKISSGLVDGDLVSEGQVLALYEPA